MSRDDQGALLVNQAAAVIVSSYLDYVNRMMTSQNVWDNLQPGARDAMILQPVELIALINDVQNALRQF